LLVVESPCQEPQATEYHISACCTCHLPRPCSLPPAGLHRYKLRLLFEVADMAPALPAVVNQHEARAYANWLSAKQVGGLLWLNLTSGRVRRVA
jgi:hypothetical protein